MAKAPRPKHVPHVCEACSQTTTYAMALDRGTAHIVLAVFNAVRRLDRNRVHIDKEMVALKHDWPSYQEMIEGGCMTSSMQHNVPRARYHGLIAFADRGSGEYLLTPKGAAFLRGEPVPKVVIVDKAKKKNAGYFEPEGIVTWAQLVRKEPYWAKGFDFEIIGDTLKPRAAGEPSQATLV
jgi:hypothetical protein